MQDGSDDCGVFAIAFATALGDNVDPHSLFLDQEKMREHLASCFEAGGRTCSRASVEEFNLMLEFCYFSLFWLDYGQLKKLHTAIGNSSTHADWF